MQLPEAIDLSHSEEYDISIRITPNRLSFVIYQQENKIFCFRKIPFTGEMSLLEHLEQTILVFDFLTLPFRTVNVLIVSTNYEFVPKDIFDQDKKNILFAFSHANQSGHVLQSAWTNEQVTLFDLDNDTYKFLMRTLFNPIFYHHSNLLASYFAKKNLLVDANHKIYLNFNNQFVDLFCFKQNELMHAISYKDIAKEDLVYHILNLWNKASFDQLSDRLYISGESEARDEIRDVLKIYIKHCEALPDESEFYMRKSDNVTLDLLTLSL